MTAESLGLENLRMITVPHPMSDITIAEVHSRAEDAVQEIIEKATTTSSEKEAGFSILRPYPAETIKVKAYDDVFPTFYNKGWTDGLPVIPPTRDKVEEMVKYTNHAPDEVVAKLPPRYGVATVERIAINAVMAGCRCEYFPVILAAVEAIADFNSNMAGWATTTGPNSPLIIINGPIRKELDINSGINALGTGRQANATIGRAINLIVRNIGGAIPGTTDMTTFGAGWEFAACVGENEEELPESWLPLNVEMGFANGTNTVTVKAINSQVDVFFHHTSEFKQVLDTIAAGIAGISSLGVVTGMQVLVAFNPEAAQLAEKDVIKSISGSIFEQPGYRSRPGGVWVTI